MVNKAFCEEPLNYYYIIITIIIINVINIIIIHTIIMLTVVMYSSSRLSTAEFQTSYRGEIQPLVSSIIYMLPPLPQPRLGSIPSAVCQSADLVVLRPLWMHPHLSTISPNPSWYRTELTRAVVNSLVEEVVRPVQSLFILLRMDFNRVT